MSDKEEFNSSLNIPLHPNNAGQSPAEDVQVYEKEDLLQDLELREQTNTGENSVVIRDFDKTLMKEDDE